MTPFAWIMALLDAAGSQPSGKAPRQCPAHADAAPSLNLNERDGKLMLFCHAGCGWRQILQALACSGSVLHRAPPVEPQAWADTFCAGLTFPKLEIIGGHPSVSGYRLEAVHDYALPHSSSAGWLLERWRHPVTKAKDLRWHTVREGAAIPGLFGVGLHELPMYREKEAATALALGETVLLVESESSVDELKTWPATTWAGGANSVPVQVLLRVFDDGDGVLVVPDVDKAGLACAQGILGTLPKARLLLGKVGEDAKDLYRRVGRHDFAVLVKEAMR